MSELRAVTLLFLIKDKKILLAMKMRGFGEGKWNGVGGKLNPGESIEEAARRECYEEIGVHPININKVAVLDFIFHNDDKNVIEGQSAHVFFCSEWDGQPTESEEMRPKWFNISDIPYNEMWDDDSFWLPSVLRGKKLHAEMLFSENNEVIEFKAKAL